MIDLRCEQMRSLTQATKDVPGNPHVSTLIRWWRRGVRGIRLETIVVGGRRFTSLEAIQRFVARLSEPHSTAVSPRGAHKVSRVDEQLDHEGIR